MQLQAFCPVTLHDDCLATLQANLILCYRAEQVLSLPKSNGETKT